FYHLYENETDSDVTLLVGQEGWQERIPAHSWVLANGSDYFRALFTGHFADPPTRVHTFPDDPKGFNNLIRWLYQNRCDLQSLQCSLDTLHVAIKYLCPDLAERCIIQLTRQINVSNVLKVLRWIYCYCSNYQPSVPSAPSQEEFERDVVDCQKDPTTSCQLLLNQCLQLIDQYSDEVLKSEHLSIADPPVLNMVLKRDTLNLSSELKIMKALHKWSTDTCKRKHLPLTLENRRKTLGSLLYLPRLLTISVSESEQMSSKQGESFRLLTQEELSFIDAYVRRASLPPVPETMKEHITAMSIPRKQEQLSSCSKA
ncbi:BTB/POZ domain-containing protein 6, partial [Armadillidium nasatum]